MPPTRLLLAAAALLPLAAVAQSRIDGVTVYPGQLARIERVAEIAVTAGGGEHVFDGLPAAVQPDSVRVAATGGDVRLGTVEVAREPVGEAPREREAELRQRIAALQQQRQAARDRVAAAKNQITFIEGLAELPQGEGAAEALTAGEGAERWSALLERIGEGARGAYEAKRANEREARDLEQEIETLRRRLDRLGGERREAVRVTVPYSAAAGGKATLRLAYRVQGPRWQPRYATRLDTAAGELVLVRSAQVQQATGEDWTEVELALSTAQPVRGQRPEPRPWWIELAPRQEPKAAADMATQSLAPEGAGRDGESGQARTVNAEFAATYAIPGRVTVPAGNQPRELRLGEDTLAAEIGATVYPQRDTRAWLTAAAEWNGEGPLPPGKVARFRDGAYVGTGVLEQWSPGQERELSFGLDPRVDVRFEPVRDEAGESGWITTRSTLARRYALNITNRHGRALPVTALFRVPVARHEAIGVETAFSRQPDTPDVDDRRGVHAWRLDLDAGAKAALELGYTVDYPEDRELRGM